MRLPDESGAEPQAALRRLGCEKTRQRVSPVRSTAWTGGAPRGDPAAQFDQEETARFARIPGQVSPESWSSEPENAQRRPKRIGSVKVDRRTMPVRKNRRRIPGQNRVPEIINGIELRDGVKRMRAIAPAEQR